MATLPPNLTKLQNSGAELARAFSFHAPVLLGWLTLAIMLLWLGVLRYQEPPVAELDRTAVSVLRLWLVLSLAGGVVPIVVRTWRTGSAAQVRWSLAGIGQVFLLRGPALLWLFFCISAIAMLLSPPAGIRTEHREHLQGALALWLVTTTLVLIIRVLWRRSRARSNRAESPAIAPASESPQ